MYNETHADKSHVNFTYMHVTIMAMIINITMMTLLKAPIKTVELLSSVLAVLVVVAVVVVVVGGTVVVVVVGGAVVVVVLRGTTHGGGYRAHDRPDFIISPPQQFALPPAREEQPAPPHVPQDLGQHTLLGSRMPDAHATSVRVHRD